MKLFNTLFSIVAVWTQTGALVHSALAPGDIALVSYIADDPDQIEFVALVDITAGEQIKFTDEGWTGSALTTAEGTWTWTAPSGGVTSGTVTAVTASSGDVAVSGSFSLDPDGDQILAFQGDASSPTVLFALNNEGTDWQANADTTQTSAEPTCAGCSVALNEADNVEYVGTFAGNRAELLASITNKNNWEGSDTRPSDGFSLASERLTVCAGGETGVGATLNLIAEDKKCATDGNRLFRTSDFDPYTAEECNQKCAETAGCNYFSVGEDWLPTTAGLFGVCIGCTAPGTVAELAGSQYNLNNFNYYGVVDPCISTASPTTSPTANPTGAPYLGQTASPTASPNFSPSQSPIRCSPLFIQSDTKCASGSTRKFRLGSSSDKYTVERCNQACLDNTDGCAYFSLGDSTSGFEGVCIGCTGPANPDPNDSAFKQAGFDYYEAFGCTQSPTSSPSVAPTAAPTASPTISPTAGPTSSPETANPTVSPTAGPTSSPETAGPTISPTASPTGSPHRTESPTASPSISPTTGPTSSPETANPTVSPTAGPTSSPETAGPTISPTASPSASPHRTESPTSSPSVSPTAGPTSSPQTASPTVSPTASPSASPQTASPTVSPTASPSASPQTESPTVSPTASPSASPMTASPTVSPTASPSTSPQTASPTVSPTASPSASPQTENPTVSPTASPSASPQTESPTVSPTASPSASPMTASPTVSPTASPSLSPMTANPTVSPTLSPTAGPTISPTASPSGSPHRTEAPTASPSTSPTAGPSSSPIRCNPRQIAVERKCPFGGSERLDRISDNAPYTVEQCNELCLNYVGSGECKYFSLGEDVVPQSNSLYGVCILCAGPSDPPDTPAYTEAGFNYYEAIDPCTESPTVSPTASPSSSPMISPTANPTVSPTASPSSSPMISPTANPTISPTANPTVSPSVSPTAAPSRSPQTESPTATPTLSPTAGPTISPTASPSGSPHRTEAPTASPSTSPTAGPSSSPIRCNPRQIAVERKCPFGGSERLDRISDNAPYTVEQCNELCLNYVGSGECKYFSLGEDVVPQSNSLYGVCILCAGPSDPPDTPAYTEAGFNYYEAIDPCTESPTVSPTASPSSSPMISPTANPTVSPTASPSSSPMISPTANPTISPTANPTVSPSVSPTAAPSRSPQTESPTVSPTASPSGSPHRTESPTASPSISPTAGPTSSPMSASPTVAPTASPSASPTLSPTVGPTISPTASPSGSPHRTESPTVSPTYSPTVGPTIGPTASPSGSPHRTESPTATPSISPTAAPSSSPIQCSPRKIADDRKCRFGVSSERLFRSPNGVPYTLEECNERCLNDPSGLCKYFSLGEDLPTTNSLYRVCIGCAGPSDPPDTSAYIQTGFNYYEAIDPCTESPTVSPTVSGTASPTASPTISPTANPTLSPTASPSKSPIQGTESPTTSPTANPTVSPSLSPTASPASPTASPSSSPIICSPRFIQGNTKCATSTPPRTFRLGSDADKYTVQRCNQACLDNADCLYFSLGDSTSGFEGVCIGCSGPANPSATPENSSNPNYQLGFDYYEAVDQVQGQCATTPTVSPTQSPTAGPTASPTISPTGSPTVSPTASPTASPVKTSSPTSSPSASPTASPSISPTVSPSASPTASPSISPTQEDNSGGIVHNPPEFSDEEPVNTGSCAVVNGQQTYLKTLQCRGNLCDFLQMTCFNSGTQVIGSSESTTEFFSDEHGGLGECPNTNEVVTGILCQSQDCDNLKLTCQPLTSETIDYRNCGETLTFPSSVSTTGSQSIPDGSFPVGSRCIGDYCGFMTIRYCFPRASNVVVSTTPEFSEPNTGVCPIVDNIQTIMDGIGCSGTNCDNVSLQCTHSGTQLVDSTVTVSDRFSDEWSGLGLCKNANEVVTQVQCENTFCDNLFLYCQKLSSLTLDYDTCDETDPTPVDVNEDGIINENGFDVIPIGTYLVGMRCTGPYCAHKQLRYCYPTGANGPLVGITNQFSEENNGQGTCPTINGFQTILVALNCDGDRCDNLRMTCVNSGSLQLGTSSVGTSFSDLQGLGECPNPNEVITSIACSGDYCESLTLTCRELTSITLDYNNCGETARFPTVIDNDGYGRIPPGAYTVGIRNLDQNSGKKTLKYCYPTQTARRYRGLRRRI